MSTLEQLKQLITELDQEELKEGIESSSPQEIERFFKELKNASTLLPLALRKTLLKQRPSLKTPHPILNYTGSSWFTPNEEGEHLIQEGKVASIVLAGGEATRLNNGQPKGFFPIMPVSSKSLFEHLFEKLKAASHKYNRPLFMAVMVSLSFLKKVEEYFKDNNYFGVDPKQVLIFKQTQLPRLSKEGLFLLQNPLKLLEASDGNGSLFECLHKEGVLAFLEKEGITQLQILPIDNPLAHPFDPNLAAAHKEGHDLIIKCCKRKSPQEKVGLLVKNENEQIEVAEYFEETLLEPSFNLANTNLFSFSLALAKELISFPFPLHIAYKNTRYFQKGQIQETLAIKLERFLFDALKQAKKPHLLLYPREECFAPLKNVTGEDGVDEVQQALIEASRIILNRFYNYHCKESKVEIPSSLLYPTTEIRAHFQEKILKK